MAIAQLEEHGDGYRDGPDGCCILDNEENPSEHHPAGPCELAPDYVDRPVAGHHQGRDDTGYD